MSGTILTFLFAATVSLFMAWTIGAGSSGSTPFAPAVGANAITTMGAGFLVGILGFAGATLQGTNVAEAVGGELVEGVVLTPVAVTSALFVAGTLMAIGIWKGYPISSAFTVTGAIIGAGFALGGTAALFKYFEIFLMWTVGPLVGIAISYILIRLFTSEGYSETQILSVLTFLVTGVLLNVEFYFPTYGMIPFTEVLLVEILSYPSYSRVILTVILSSLLAYVVYNRSKGNQKQTMKQFLLVIGSIVAFSAGGSQVGLAAGPLIPLTSDIPISVSAVVIGCGVGLLLGSWTGAPRMIKAVSQDYAQLGPRRSISALIPAFLLAQAAILFGVPISFNQMVVGCIFGAGLGSKKDSSSDTDGVGKKKMAITIGAWIATLVGSYIITYGIVYMIS